MKVLDIIANGLGAVASFAAACFWLRSALIDVPDNMDTFVRELQRIAWWNSGAAMAATVAAVCGFYLFIRQLLIS